VKEEVEAIVVPFRVLEERRVDEEVPELDVEALEAVRTYNAGHYLEAHELFELIWMRQGGARKIFYQGLVHVAMGFHYLVAGDFDRASAKLQRAAELLEDFAVDFLGFDVWTLRGSVALCRHRLAELGASSITRFDRTLIPRLTLLPHATQEAR
jgi:predicted metal-dependent hydrolase